MAHQRFKTDNNFNNRAKWTVRYSPVTGRFHPRRGQPWSVAEDRRLRRLVRKQFRNSRRGRGYDAWSKIAHALGRTALAVMTRWSVIKVVDTHRRADARRRRRRS